MSSQCTQPAMDVYELPPSPLVGMSQRDGRPVHPDVMNQAFREHRDLETQSSRNRCAIGQLNVAVISKAGAPLRRFSHFALRKSPRLA